MTKKHKKIREVAGGVAIGGAIGALLGVIFAPKKGKDTRDSIKNRGKGLFKKIFSKK